MTNAWKNSIHAQYKRINTQCERINDVYDKRIKNLYDYHMVSEFEKNMYESRYTRDFWSLTNAEFLPTDPSFIENIKMTSQNPLTKIMIKWPIKLYVVSIVIEHFFKQIYVPRTIC